MKTLILLLTLSMLSTHSVALNFKTQDNSFETDGNIHFSTAMAVQNKTNTSPLQTVSSTDLIISQALAFPSPALHSVTDIGFRSNHVVDLEFSLFDHLGAKLFLTSLTSHIGYNRIALTPDTLGFTLSNNVYYFVLTRNGDLISKGSFANKNYD